VIRYEVWTLHASGKQLLASVWLTRESADGHAGCLDSQRKAWESWPIYHVVEGITMPEREGIYDYRGASYRITKLITSCPTCGHPHAEDSLKCRACERTAEAQTELDSCSDGVFYVGYNERARESKAKLKARVDEAWAAYDAAYFNTRASSAAYDDARADYLEAYEAYESVDDE